MLYVCTPFQWVWVTGTGSCFQFSCGYTHLDDSQSIPFHISTLFPLPLVISYDLGHWALNPRGATRALIVFSLSIKTTPGSGRCARWTQKPSQPTDTRLDLCLPSPPHPHREEIRPRRHRRPKNLPTLFWFLKLPWCMGGQTSLTGPV